MFRSALASKWLSNVVWRMLDRVDLSNWSFATLPPIDNSAPFLTSLRLSFFWSQQSVDVVLKLTHLQKLVVSSARSMDTSAFSSLLHLTSLTFPSFSIASLPPKLKHLTIGADEVLPLMVPESIALPALPSLEYLGAGSVALSFSMLADILKLAPNLKKIACYNIISDLHDNVLELAKVVQRPELVFLAPNGHSAWIHPQTGLRTAFLDPLLSTPSFRMDAEDFEG